MKRLWLLAALLLLCLPSAYLFCQIAGSNCSFGTTPQCSDSQTISSSGASIVILSNGGMSTSFEYLIQGSPATVSIVLQGCGQLGTCETLDTYSTVANSIRNPSLSKPYAYFKVTATWTGGTTASVKVSTTITTSRNGGGSGSGSGLTSVGITPPSSLLSGGAAITSNGSISLGLANAAQNFVWAGPASGGTGAPVYRQLVIADLPSTLATQSSVQQQAYNYAADAGTANAYTVTLAPIPTLVAGSPVVFKAANANTGASTLAVNGGAAVTILKHGTQALTGGEISAGQIVRVAYDGTNFQMQSEPSIATQAANTVQAGPATGAAAQPTYRSLVLADLPPGYLYSNLGGTVPTWNQNTTGTAFGWTMTGSGTGQQVTASGGLAAFGGLTTGTTSSAGGISLGDGGGHVATIQADSTETASTLFTLPHTAGTLALQNANTTGTAGGLSGTPNITVGSVTASSVAVGTTVSVVTPSTAAQVAIPSGAHGVAMDCSTTAGVPASGVNYFRSDCTKGLVESINGAPEVSVLRLLSAVLYIPSPYTTAITFPLYHVPSTFTGIITIPANCSNWTWDSIAAAAASDTFTVAKNGSTICTGTIASLGTTVSWAGTGTATTLTGSDKLTAVFSGDTSLEGSLQINATY